MQGQALEDLGGPRGVLCCPPDCTGILFLHWSPYLRCHSWLPACGLGFPFLLFLLLKTLDVLDPS